MNQNETFTAIISFGMPLLFLGFVCSLVGGMMKVMVGSSSSSSFLPGSQKRRLGNPELPKGLFALWNTWVSTPILTDLVRGPVINGRLEAIGVTPKAALESLKQQEEAVRVTLPPSMVVYRGIPDAGELLARKPSHLTLRVVTSTSDTKEKAQWFAQPIIPGQRGAIAGLRVNRDNILSSWQTNPYIYEWEREVIIKPGHYSIESIEEWRETKMREAVGIA